MNLLEIKDLQLAFKSGKNELIAVDNVSFSVKPGETIGIVGESGCGKSVTSLAILNLLGKNGWIKNGEITFQNTKLNELNENQMRKIRGNEIAMIFQDPMTSLNPVFTIGEQLTEVTQLHLGLSKKEAIEHAIDMLQKVGIPGPEEIIYEYPHALSGGMRQRVVIAMAISCNPKLLIADEPTTALDVTIQAQILDLMKKLCQESDMSIIFITHDLGVVAEMADRIIVMYAGQVVEETDVFALFKNTKHPYAQGLLKSIPRVDTENDKRLYSIKGTVPPLHNMPKGCRFYTRCPYAWEKCETSLPGLEVVQANHKVRCWLTNETKGEN